MTDARDRDLTPYEDDPLLRRLAATLSEAEAAVPAAPRDLVATTRSRYARGRARRNRLAVVASMLLVLVTSTVAAGGIPDELRPGIVGARPGPDVVRVWTLRSEWRGEALRRLADKFRADTGTRVEITEFANE
ncbi:MAG TPA: hypothetical protein VFT95_02080, partial [Micromonosporaceae bacterium]|nr:hypothetical protein [Micromonosporaceae bacterium]